MASLWYLESFVKQCQDCGKPATCSLRNPKSAFWGNFCERHGEERVQSLNETIRMAQKRENA